MKTEPKAFASLSSGLLARKGAARPAMRPQGFGSQVGGGLDDLGWNDMGFEPPKPTDALPRDESHDAFGEEIPEQPLRNPIAALTPIGSPVHDQQAELADRIGAEADEAEEIDEEFDETAEPFEQAEAEIVAISARTSAADLEPAPAPIAVAPEAPSEAPIAVAQAAPRRQPKARSAPGANGKAAFTLRLNPERHLKLRLACAVSGRSAQMLVTDALDELLSSMPELDSMAERAPAKRAKA